MKLCIWCNDPSMEDTLCPPCRAANDGPRFYCPKKYHGRTMGDRCASCEDEIELKKNIELRKAAHKEELEKIRLIFMESFKPGTMVPIAYINFLNKVFNADN